MIVLICKEQIEHFEDVPEEIASQMIWVSQKLMKALKRTYPESVKIALQIEGLDVPHAHIKLVPITQAADLKAEPPSVGPNHTELAKQAERINQNI